MSQLHQPGHLYVVECAPWTKVGWALSRKARLASYRQHNPNVTSFEWTHPGTRFDETQVHRRLADAGLEPGHKEWFKATPEEVIAVAKAYFDEVGNERSIELSAIGGVPAIYERRMRIMEREREDYRKLIHRPAVGLAKYGVNDRVHLRTIDEHGRRCPWPYNAIPGRTIVEQAIIARGHEDYRLSPCTLVRAAVQHAEGLLSRTQIERVAETLRDYQAPITLSPPWPSTLVGPGWHERTEPLTPWERPPNPLNELFKHANGG